MGNSWMGPEVAELTEQYMARKIGRRQFMKRMGVAGVGVAAAASILAACGEDEPEPVATTAAPTTAAPTTTEAVMTGPVAGGTLREGYNRDVSKQSRHPQLVRPTGVLRHLRGDPVERSERRHRSPVRIGILRRG